jgi:hypothetical protein
LHQLVETPPNMIPISPHQLRNLPNILKIRKQTSFLYITFMTNALHTYVDCVSDSISVKIYGKWINMIYDMIPLYFTTPSFRLMTLDVKPVIYHSWLTSQHLRVTQHTITK